MRAGFALLCAILLGACGASGKRAAESDNARRQAKSLTARSGARTVAPPFVLKTLDGRSISLKSLGGKVVLIDLWASWCAPCVKSMPALARLQRSYGKDGLVILAVTVDEDPKKLQDFLLRRPPGVTVVRPDGAFNRNYGTLLGLKSHLIVTPDKMIQANLPSWVVIDRNGRVAAIHKSSAEERQVVSETASLATRA